MLLSWGTSPVGDSNTVAAQPGGVGGLQGGWRRRRSGLCHWAHRQPVLLGLLFHFWHHQRRQRVEEIVQIKNMPVFKLRIEIMYWGCSTAMLDPQRMHRHQKISRTQKMKDSRSYAVRAEQDINICTFWDHLQPFGHFVNFEYWPILFKWGPNRTIKGRNGTILVPTGTIQGPTVPLEHR